MILNLDKWPIFSLLDQEFLASIKLACVFGNSGNEAIIVTKDDNVYSLGSNCSGCLGLGKIYYFTNCLPTWTVDEILLPGYY